MFDKLSRGYQSIIRIIIGMASNSPITIFDEPVLGLDAVARDQFYRVLIENFSINSRMFIISTHFIEESADLFDEAIIIKEGKILQKDSVESLLANNFYVSGKAEIVDQFTQNYNILSTQNIPGIKTVVVEGNLSKIEQIPELTFSKLTIQKLFIHLVGDQISEEI
jgi:ABC-2 type transport system ATP-binding protein